MTPNGSLTVGGSFFPSGPPYLIILSMSHVARRERTAHRTAFTANQAMRFAGLFGKLPPLLPSHPEPDSLWRTLSERRTRFVPCGTGKT
jgi:hypothetical protein